MTGNARLHSRGKLANFMLVLWLLIPGGAFAQVFTNAPRMVVLTNETLVWDPVTVEHTATNGEVAAHIVFKVKNSSLNEVLVDDLQTSCECTLATMPSRPWRFAPGETNKL